MALTDRNQLVEVGAPAVVPRIDVVHPALVDRHRAPRHHARRVHHGDRTALGGAGEPTAAALVEDLAGTTEHERHDRGVARQPSDHLGRQRHTADRLADRRVVHAVFERLEIGDHGHLWHPPVDRPGPGDQLDERIGLDVIPVHGRIDQPGPTIAGRGLQRGGDLGVGLGIERQQRLVHPRAGIDPATYPALATERLQPGLAVVAGQQAHQVAAVPLERLDRANHGRRHEARAQLDQLITPGLGQRRGGPGHGVDVTRRHHAGLQRGGEPGHRRAHLAVRRSHGGVTAPPAPTVGQHRGGRGSGAFGGERRGALGAAGLVGVEPCAHPLDIMDEIDQ